MQTYNSERVRAAELCNNTFSPFVSNITAVLSKSKSQASKALCGRHVSIKVRWTWNAPGALKVRLVINLRC